MRISRDVKPREKLWASLCVALLLLLTACQANTGQEANNPLFQIPVQNQYGSPVASSSPIGLQISPHNGQPATPTKGTTGTYNTGASPGPVPTGNGPIPAAFPHYFSFGVMSPPATASALDDMRSTNGAAFTFRYQYLTGGANTGRGWETWQQPAGQFAAYYMQESDQHGYIPTFVYYEICLTNGPHPSDYCGGHNVEQDTGNLASASAMNAYFGNWVLMLQKIRAYGKPE